MLTVHIVRLFVCPDIITLSRQPIQLGKFYECKILLFSYPSILTYVLGAQKNRLVEEFLLSTHKICFG